MGDSQTATYERLVNKFDDDIVLVLDSEKNNDSIRLRESGQLRILLRKTIYDIVHTAHLQLDASYQVKLYSYICEYLKNANEYLLAIEWAAQSLPNLRKSPKPPAASKKTPASSKKEKSSSPAIEPIKQNSPEKTISIPAVNTPVPKPSANTAQKRTRVKKVPTTIASSTTTTTIASSVSSNKAYPLPVPGTAGFVYVVPIIIAAILLWYFSRK
jgi:cobalamin biosynthesis Mg chelatase CobN